MLTETINKLKILAGAAKYDVSCASSGSNRPNTGKGLGNAAPWGICHSFTEDGRCISLLKLMLTNYCIYDCAYCANRKSNDIRRTTFTVIEVVELTIAFYRRNYIEGLFLSSGVIVNPDYTMERMVQVAKDLRIKHNYHGYIHLKSIPGASDELQQKAGLYADRLSVNIEIATEPNLKMLAPDKNYMSIMNPMTTIKNKIIENKEDRRKFRSAPRFSPAGQSTQLIVGATPDSDKQILSLAGNLYTNQNLKRVYYSGFIPVNSYDKRLPALAEPPLRRENRLYQADWLFRFYHFSIEEIVNDNHPDLDLEIDPKLSYALRNPWLFPIDINKASYETLLRVPGIGVKSAKLIVVSRQYNKLTTENLKKIGVVLKRAKYFITCNELKMPTVNEISPEYVRKALLSDNVQAKNNNKSKLYKQLSLFP
ncbi:MAG: putative DNA modification/repair radical SAM protein [Bacteroidetes bacterium GWF2_33_16]|nr:MAG: putative DNA modification/repair radical SAM protein [Bacteroidetes bacterium GWE2_32_14]OFY07069.1 MAG: putative DNA modification/repair radical SAM protein [Bacteroidetes bacterium GWF2_33_16]